MNANLLLTHFDRIAAAPDAVPRLRRFILDLAVRGWLVRQDANDEPASELVKRITAEKEKHQESGPLGKLLPSLAGNETPFPIPENWKWVRLGEVATSSLGKTLNQAKNKGAYKPYLRSVNVYWFKLDLTDLKEMKFEEQEFEKYALRAGDVLVCEGGEAGRAAIWNNEMEGVFYQNALHRVRLLGDIEPNFLVFSLNSDSNNGRLATYCTGVTIKHLTTKRLLNYCFPLPPLAEQHRIVAKVDELMALCDRLEAARTERETTRNRLAAASLARLNAPDADPPTFRKDATLALDNLTPLTTRPDQIKALRQTILNLAVRGKLVPQDPSDRPASEMLNRIVTEDKVGQGGKKKKEAPSFDSSHLLLSLPPNWAWSRLSEISRKIHYGFTASANHRADRIRLLRITDIQQNQVRWNSLPGCEIDEKALSNFQLETGDILVARTGGTIGKTFLVDELPVVAVFASYLIRIQVSHDIYARYVKLFLESQIYWMQLKEGSRGTGQPNVNGQTLSKMLVPLPPLSEQRRIVAKVNELMALCDRLEASLTTRDETRRRLLESVLHEVLESGGQTAAY